MQADFVMYYRSNGKHAELSWKRLMNHYQCLDAGMEHAYPSYRKTSLKETVS